MMICPKCGDNLSLFGDIYICNNEGCGYSEIM